VSLTVGAGVSALDEKTDPLSVTRRNGEAAHDALVERFIVEAEAYLATHPNASMVLEELKLLRAYLPASRAELTDLRRSKSRGKTQG
jgi:hypothetical protein